MKPTMTNLTEAELAYLRSLVRQDMRKTERNRAAAYVRYGPDYDPSRHEAKMAAQRQVYQALGGNPDNITNLAPSLDGPGGPQTAPEPLGEPEGT
jgi:hypothetical protein